jgi:hypothetical protein
VPTSRVFATHKLLQVVDLKEDRSYLDRDALAVASVELAGIRTLISVPMLKEDAAVGTLNVADIPKMSVFDGNAFVRHSGAREWTAHLRAVIAAVPTSALIRLR